jgi:hypothetical protein
MAGYSGTPLARKLGIKAGSEILLVGDPEDYLKLLEPLPDAVRFVSRVSESTDIIHFFSARKAELKQALSEFRAKIRPTTMLWVSWPKKSAKVPTDITEDTVREIALPIGFVDVKVCAVDNIWSGLKLVIRKELR